MKYKSFPGYLFCIHSHIYITWVEKCNIQQVLRMHKESIPSVLPKKFLIYNLSSFSQQSNLLFVLIILIHCYFSGMYLASIGSFPK